MNRKIAVENGLTPVMEYLSEKGYKVDGIDLSSEYRKDIDKYDAIVVTGMNKDFLGVHDVVSKVPVIDASGLSAEQVYKSISSKFH